MAQASRDPNSSMRLRPVQMPTALSTCRHSGQLVSHIANRTFLERMGLAASRRLESCMQSLEMTGLPKPDRQEDSPKQFGRNRRSGGAMNSDAAVTP